jgi:hypothetical protein
MTEAGSSASWRRYAGPIASAIVALAWVVLASRRPGAHYHFAPLFVTVAWPYGHRWTVGRPLTSGETAASIAGGALVTTATALGLLATDRLEGVTFWHSDAVLVEVALMIAMGALWSLWAARRPEPGRDDRSEDLDTMPSG